MDSVSKTCYNANLIRSSLNLNRNIKRAPTNMNVSIAVAICGGLAFLLSVIGGILYIRSSRALHRRRRCKCAEKGINCPYPGVEGDGRIVIASMERDIPFLQRLLGRWVRLWNLRHERKISRSDTGVRGVEIKYNSGGRRKFKKQGEKVEGEEQQTMGLSPGTRSLSISKSSASHTRMASQERLLGTLHDQERERNVGPTGLFYAAEGFTDQTPSSHDTSPYKHPPSAFRTQPTSKPSTIPSGSMSDSTSSRSKLIQDYSPFSPISPLLPHQRLLTPLSALISPVSRSQSPAVSPLNRIRSLSTNDLHRRYNGASSAGLAIHSPSPIKHSSSYSHSPGIGALASLHSKNRSLSAIDLSRVSSPELHSDLSAIIAELQQRPLRRRANSLSTPTASAAAEPVELEASLGTWKASEQMGKGVIAVSEVQGGEVAVEADSRPVGLGLRRTRRFAGRVK